MAIGRAVVASRVDGIPDAVVDGETGLLVPPENPGALAAALAALLADPIRCANFGRRGREVVRQELTWEKAAERYLQTLAAATSAFATSR
jgi:starch synthase